jgi:flavin-dependent dehydrogenase
MKTPVAIVGGGPGGAALALYLAREGIKSTIIEKDEFPRYHIGESMSGEAGNLLRGLGLDKKMIERRHPIKWGLHVYGRSPVPWYVPVKMRTPENELKEVFTWQVRRSDFDKMMLEEALAAGVELVRGQATKPIMADDGSARGVQVRMNDGGLQEIESELLVDVSGQAKWLASLGLTSKLELGHYEKQVAIFSQVKGAIRDEGKFNGNTLIFYKQLVHWAWFIPIDDEITSVGVVCPGSYFTSKRETKHDFLYRELHDLHPELKRRIPDRELIEETRAMQNYSYQAQQYCGKGWLCIGDAHRFIDPIFSFGLYLTLKEAHLAAPSIRAYLEGANRDAADPFAAHAGLCDFGGDKLQDLIDGFWTNPLAFALVAHHKYPDGTIDLFAGRIFGQDHNPALEAMRGIKKHNRGFWDQPSNWWDELSVETDEAAPGSGSGKP